MNRKPTFGMRTGVVGGGGRAVVAEEEGEGVVVVNHELVAGANVAAMGRD